MHASSSVLHGGLGGSGIVVHQAQHVLIPGSSWCRDELELKLPTVFGRLKLEVGAGVL